jgi:hypothetical protein
MIIKSKAGIGGIVSLIIKIKRVPNPPIQIPGRGSNAALYYKSNTRFTAYCQKLN